MHIALQQVTKSFGQGKRLKVAVDGVSWSAGGGEVFGLLGPNGAGKTTMIRMLLDIIRPDSGQILIDGDPRGNRQQSFKSAIGYLPEERGLYRKRKVLDVLSYFGALKGMSSPDARQRATEMLQRFDLSAWAHRKVEDLSKGMSQKIQLASCLLHRPTMVVLDEPFSGLDPVNVRVVRQLILELKREGRLVFLSTHMMSEVEALCDRIFMIHEGRQVLYGVLEEIKRSHSDSELLLDADAEPEGLSTVERVRTTDKGKYVHLAAGCTIHDFMSEMAAGRRQFKRLEEATTPIEDIFVSVVNSK